MERVGGGKVSNLLLLKCTNDTKGWWTEGEKYPTRAVVGGLILVGCDALERELTQKKGGGCKQAHTIMICSDRVRIISFLLVQLWKEKTNTVYHATFLKR
jgi:hypothetical protein